MEGNLLLAFKKHNSVCYLAELMLALHCIYGQRSHKCPECKSKEGEGKYLRKHIFMSQVIFGFWLNPLWVHLVLSLRPSTES